MRYPNKRHYRVVERDRDTLDETTLSLTDDLQKLALLGLIMYLCSTFLSFTLGYFIGKNQ